MNERKHATHMQARMREGDQGHKRQQQQQQQEKKRNSIIK